MKKCPTCGTQFDDDNLKFCKADGTPLETAVVNNDPYKTIVGGAGDFQIPPREVERREPEKSEPSAIQGEDILEVESDPGKTIVTGKETAPEVLVDIPEIDEVVKEPAEVIDPEVAKEVKPLDEDKAKLSSHPEVEEKRAVEESKEKEAEPVIPFIPPTPTPTKAPEPPTPAPNPAPPPNNQANPNPGTPPAPPSPFNDDSIGEDSRPSIPIPSPLDLSMPPGYALPSTPPFDPGEAVRAEKVGSMKATDADNLKASSAPVGSAEVEVKNGEKGGGTSSVFALISLVLGVLSVTICCGTGLFSVFAIILGIVAKSKIKNDPTKYSGNGMATAGIITGVLGLILSIVMTVLWFTGVFARFIPGTF
ncbi:MAG: DUF4190 domain-containing protein [Pyrinomonadaceae bacterium]